MTRSRKHPCRISVVLLLLTALPAVAVPGGPYDAWAIYDGGRISVPNHPDLNPTAEITLEAWVFLNGSHDGCDTVVGKDWTTNYWFGICDGLIRTWLGGEEMESEQVSVPFNRWVHVGFTSDGTIRRHYIDGGVALEAPETGSLTPNIRELAIGNDLAFGSYPFDGSIDEVRLWDRALSTDELRSYSRFAVERPLPGLVAVWDFGPNDQFGNHDGTIIGSVLGLTFPAGACWNTTEQYCLDGRFQVSAQWFTDSDSGTAFTVPPASEDTGLFWFFAPDNWEVMIKVLNGCPINDRFWVFIAASTDQGYEITVRDALTGDSKTYGKLVGPPAPATTDTAALDVCNPF